MTVSSLQSLVNDTTKLFSLPDIYFQLSEMVRDPRYTMTDFGKVISKDPALCARLLRIVNSPFYGFQSKVDTISRAITIIGIDDLNNLILATSVVDEFSRIPCELVDMTAYWMRSVHCGVIARLLAKRSGVLHAERLFLAGLLHDIGSLVLYIRMPDAARTVLLAANHDRGLVPGFEYQIIGFTHADVGRELLKSWGLPESLYETVGCYLEPSRALVHKLDAHLLNISALLADSGRYADGVEATAAMLSEQSLSLTRLSREQIVALMGQVEGEFMHMFELLSPGKRFH